MYNECVTYHYPIMQTINSARGKDIYEVLKLITVFCLIFPLKALAVLKCWVKLDNTGIFPLAILNMLSFMMVFKRMTSRIYSSQTPQIRGIHSVSDCREKNCVNPEFDSVKTFSHDTESWAR